MLSRLNTPANLLLAALTLLALATAGCNSSSRQGIEGTVKFDGTPLADGLISFLPQAGTAGPTAGSRITQGAYHIDRAKSLLPGSYRVEISGWRKTGGKKKDMFGREVDETEQIVPSRYNKDSELTVDVADDRSTQFDFDLSSK
jgi:hypothetical protein